MTVYPRSVKVWLTAGVGFCKGRFRGLGGADCLSDGSSRGSVARVAVERRLEEVATLGRDADGEGVRTVGGGGGGADGGPLFSGVLAEEDDQFVGDGGAVGD